MKFIKLINKKYLLIILISTIIIALLSFSSAYAEQIVNWVKAEPNDIIINQSTVVTIAAQIDADPSLIKSNIDLRRIDNNGNILENFGILYDDGTHGDSVADDNIFTTQIMINENEIKKVYLEVSVVYKGSIERRNYYCSLNIVVQESAESTRSQFVSAIRAGDLASAGSKLISSTDWESLDRASQLRFADWIENAIPIESSENCTIYKGLWEDQMGVRFELTFMILKTESGEWKING
jgi:hypothetical protein